jgi:hypothetical protein
MEEHCGRVPYVKLELWKEARTEKRELAVF